MDKLIRKEDALELLFSKWEPKRQTERVSVTQAAGRILAEDIFAAYNLPVVRASRMDGIAVHSSVFANGKPDTSGWKPGVDYIRADTGDDFDDAYDAVIAIEQVTFLPEGGLRLSDDVQVSAGSCVKPCGADLKQGSLIAKAGTVLHAQTLAAAAMSGVAELTVVKKPQVAFIPTGSELVKVGSALKRGQNFDTNSILVQQMLQDMGAEPILHPIVPDDPNAIRAALESVWEQSDIVLINAGTSKGGEDYSFRILEEAGEMLFHGVAAVPGRPMSMAVADGKPLVNLSGPAFAAFYSMDWAIRAIVCHALGIAIPVRERVRAELTEEFRTPPMLSMLASFQLQQDADGHYLATPIVLRGPKAAGVADSLMADAVYPTTPGEKPLRAGDWIEVELLKNRSEIE